jgi:hypothetical protein
LIPKYFSKEATRPIGISDDIRERIMQHFEQDLAPPGLFLEAQTQVRFRKVSMLGFENGSDVSFAEVSRRFDLKDFRPFF